MDMINSIKQVLRLLLGTFIFGVMAPIIIIIDWIITNDKTLMESVWTIKEDFFKFITPLEK